MKKKDIVVNFPRIGYQAKKFSWKKAFKVTLHEIQEKAADLN